MSQTPPEALSSAAHHSPPSAGASRALAQLPRSSTALSPSFRSSSPFVGVGCRAACAPVVTTKRGYGVCRRSKGPCTTTPDPAWSAWNGERCGVICCAAHACSHVSPPLLPPACSTPCSIACCEGCGAWGRSPELFRPITEALASASLGTARRAMTCLRLCLSCWRAASSSPARRPSASPHRPFRPHKGQRSRRRYSSSRWNTADSRAATARCRSSSFCRHKSI